MVKRESSKTVTSAPIGQPHAAYPIDTPETSSVPGPRSVSAGSRLDIPEPEFDFGCVPQHAKVSHVFWLYSSGTDTLRILQVNPG